ncbi:hypothetical protein EYF80_066099 [Liparis tanakae]|uniref:Uncharacterized protein n=1 Tax=Liparis tanakae TaxID=230148 RepID=A0A4Z2E4W1_9TELE|nr:hypothetical protein EYF80_066099 [Liparis tanakae]
MMMKMTVMTVRMMKMVMRTVMTVRMMKMVMRTVMTVRMMKMVMSLCFTVSRRPELELWKPSLSCGWRLCCPPLPTSCPSRRWPTGVRRG